MSISGSRYIPKNAVEFVNWLVILVAYVQKNYARWGIASLNDDYDTRIDELRRLTDKCIDKEHTPVDTFRRNEARKAIEKDVRALLKGFILYNPNVTGEDRRIMSLPVYDKVRTPVGAPVGLVTAMVKYPQEGALELHIGHVDTTPFDKRANYGVKIVYNVFPADAPLPENVDTLHRSEFTRRKKILFTFGDGNSGKRAAFRLRYESSKGEAGEWGPTVSAIIP